MALVIRSESCFHSARRCRTPKDAKLVPLGGIAVCVASLVLIPQAVVAAHGLPDIIRAGLRTLFFVWVIWYLSQPHVKAAFRAAAPVQASNNSQ